MGKDELEQAFLEKLGNGDLVLYLGKGEAKYKSKRGSLKTSDTIRETHKLHYLSHEGNHFFYGDGKIQMEVHAHREGENLKFHFHAPEGYNRFVFHLKTFDNEHFYGCGEQADLPLDGQHVRIWVSERQQVKEIVKKLFAWKLRGPKPDKASPLSRQQTYVAVPCFLSSCHYGIYCHEDAYGEIRFGKGYVEIVFRQIPQSISILTGDSCQEVAEKMARLVGIQEKIPSWVGQGIILPVQGGMDVLKQKYEEAKKAGMKVAAIWSQDWSGNVVTSFGYQVFWNWQADEKLYPGLKEFIQELNRDGVRFLGYINPYLKVDSPLYLEAKEKGFLVTKKDGSIYPIKSTTFDAGIVDLTNPEAYAWYKNIIKKNMIEYGLSGWMADFGEYLPGDAVLAGGSPERMHNRWPTLWAKCCREAIEEEGKQDEIFIFNRAAYGHSIHYINSIWNGDQHVDWSDDYGLGSIIPSNISLSCSGVGVTHSDIGGYTTLMMMKRSPELLKRWSEANLFSPVYRGHEGNRPQDNAQILSPDCIEELAKNSRIFAALSPYRDAVLARYYAQGTPCYRPLFFAYPEDERSYLEKKEILFGDDLLVSPVVRPDEVKHKVYLPDEGYIQLFTNQPMSKGESEVDSPLGLPIAFYRKDSEFSSLFASLSQYFTKEE